METFLGASLAPTGRGGYLLLQTILMGHELTESWAEIIAWMAAKIEKYRSALVPLFGAAELTAPSTGPVAHEAPGGMIRTILYIKGVDKPINTPSGPSLPGGKKWPRRDFKRRGAM